AGLAGRPGHLVAGRGERPDDERQHAERQDGRGGPLPDERLDPQVLDPVDGEQHEHEQDEDDDGAGVDDDLHGGQEVRLLGHEQHGDAEQGADERQRRVHRVLAEDDAQRADQAGRGGDGEDDQLDHQALPPASRWPSLPGGGSWAARPPGSPGWAKMASASPVSTSPSSADCPRSGSLTPKPSSPDQATRPTKSASPDGAVARIHAEVIGATRSMSDQSSHGSWRGLPSSPTTSSAFV